ncbi:MAG: hypothetical protein WBD02_11280 [Acidimicrobiia bacterium]
MSFDVTFWCPNGVALDLGGLHNFLVCDERVNGVDPFDDEEFIATIGIGGESWSEFSVENAEELYGDDPEFSVGPVGTVSTGARFEMSYSTPQPVVDETFKFVVEVAARFSWVIVDEQVGTDFAADLDGLRRSWEQSRGLARGVLGHH